MAPLRWGPRLEREPRPDFSPANDHSKDDRYYKAFCESASHPIPSGPRPGSDGLKDICHPPESATVLSAPCPTRPPMLRRSPPPLSDLPDNALEQALHFSVLKITCGNFISVQRFFRSYFILNYSSVNIVVNIEVYRVEISFVTLVGPDFWSAALLGFKSEIYDGIQCFSYHILHYIIPYHIASNKFS